MKISIIGSKHTKDILNNRYNPDCRAQFKLMSYAPVISFLSLMSGPVLYNYRRMLMLEMEDNVLVRNYIDLEKNILKTLESVQPDVLLIDFYADARYGAISYESEYVTNKCEGITKNSILIGKYLGIEYSYKANTDDFIIVWKNYFDRFMSYMREKLPSTQIIVNTVKATEYVARAGRKISIPENEDMVPVDIERMNKIWNIFDKYAIKKYDLKSISSNNEYTMELPLVDGLSEDIQTMQFERDYYTDYYNSLLENIDKKKIVEVKESHQNLVSDSHFKYQLNYWSNIKGKYDFIPYKKYKGIKVIDCSEQMGEYSPQLWSRPIEIQGDGETEYTLSFYITIPDMSKIDDQFIIFRMRTFIHMKQVKAKEAIERHRLTLEGHNIKEGIEYRYVYKFKPIGRCIKLAPFLNECIPGVEYNRIKLERASSVSDYTR